MVRVILYNNKSQILADAKILYKLRETYKLRAKGTFFNPLVRQGRWDGWVRYISEVNGLISTGLLHEVLPILDEWEIDYTIEDRRNSFRAVGVPDDLAGDKLRPDQAEVVNKVIENRLKGVRFIRGMIDAATNYGKSYVIAGIFKSFAGKRNGALLIHSKTIFVQLVDDLKKLMPDEVGEISTRKVDIKRFNVCMVQTVQARIKKDPAIKRFLNTCDICLVDEADEGTSAAHKTCYKECENASVRIGLTGTAETAKDPVKRREIISFFGPIIVKITNAENIKAGVSTVPKVSIFNGNKSTEDYRSYRVNYTKLIIENRQRNKKVWKRIAKNVKRRRWPILVMLKERVHAKHMIKVMPKELNDLNVKYIFHDTPDREEVIKDFSQGNLHVMFAGFFIKRGKNMPLMKALINAAGGDSETNLLQILGRALRKHKSKKKVYVEDFYDEDASKNHNLRRHSKHRIAYYKKQKIEVVEYYKKGKTIKK